MYLDGEKAGDVMKELCKQICKQDEDISVAKQSSMQDVCEEAWPINQFRSDPSYIGMAISNIGPAIRQFQEFMDRNKKFPDDEFWTEPTIQ